jgi:hypothetical protein
MLRIFFYVLVTVLATGATANPWQLSENHDAFVATSGKSYPRSVYLMSGTAQASVLNSAPVAVDIAMRCRKMVVTTFSLWVHIPFSATSMAGQEDQFRGNSYRFNISAKLAGGTSRPVLLHQEGSFHINKNNPELRIDLSQIFLSVGVMSPDDVAAAVEHLSSPSPYLSLIVGRSLRHRGVLYSGRVTLDGAAQAFQEHIIGNCPDLREMTGEFDQPDSVSQTQLRDVKWYEFESTRFNSAQRVAFEARARNILSRAKALVCTYPASGGGARSYEFWYHHVPEGVQDLIKTSGLTNTRGAQLGSMAVNLCPETDELAAIVRNHDWPK